MVGTAALYLLCDVHHAVDTRGATWRVLEVFWEAIRDVCGVDRIAGRGEGVLVCAWCEVRECDGVSDGGEREERDCPC